MLLNIITGILSTSAMTDGNTTGSRNVNCADFFQKFLNLVNFLGSASEINKLAISGSSLAVICDKENYLHIPSQYPPISILKN